MPVTSGLSIARQPVAEVLADPLDVVEQVLVGDRVSTASAAAHATGLPPKVLP